jgi:dihydrofolate reductase
MIRELIVTEFVSLDGVMEAPGGEAGYVHSGWVADFFTDELGAYKLEEQLAAETLLLGRRTYDSFAGAWPERDDPFADKGQRHGEGRGVRSLTSVDWEHSRLLDGPLEDAVAALKQGDGGPIVIAGGRSIVQPPLTAGLVDELHLQVFPFLLGSGMRLYPETPQKTPLQLVASRALENGVVLQTYRPATDQA